MTPTQEFYSLLHLLFKARNQLVDYLTGQGATKYESCTGFIFKCYKYQEYDSCTGVILLIYSILAANRDNGIRW